MSSRNQAILEAIDSQMKRTESVAHEPEWVFCIAQGATPTYHTHSDSNATIVGSTGSTALKDFAPITEFEFAMTRGIQTEAMSHDLIASGLCAHELKIIAPFGSVDNAVHGMFLANQVLDHVMVARLITITADSGSATAPTLAIACEYKFHHVYISASVAQGDSVCLSFRYLAMQYSKTSYNPLTGAAQGAASTMYRNLANLSSTKA